MRSSLGAILFAVSIGVFTVGCGSVSEGPDDPDASGGGNGDAGGGNADAAPPCQPNDPDTDNDGVCDSNDRCPGFDDANDADADTVPDGCDVCAGNDDTLDADNDDVPDGCDICAGYDDSVDADNDSVPDGCDVCAGQDDNLDDDMDDVPNGCDICVGYDDNVDTDNDGIPNGCDLCMPGDDTVDTDNDGVPNDCDVCPGFDDNVDSDNDNVPNGCDVCPGFNDNVDSDNDNVPNGCDICNGFDDNVDTDNDGVPNGCDVCNGFDDNVDTDNDGVPNGCDVCNGFDDNVDSDNDGVPNGCDLCPGFNDNVDNNPSNGIPDGCDCTGFKTTWCYQQGTMEQFTRCASTSNNGYTCNFPEIKYGFVEGGVPRQHTGNDFDTWCQQLGFGAYGDSVSYGQRNVASPYGVVFGCSAYDETTWHWCDWSDGDWYNESLDYHATATNDIVSITCADPEFSINLTPGTGTLIQTDDPYWASKGYRFTASQTFTVTAFEWWINLPSAANLRARVYNSAGTLLRSGSVVTGQNNEQWYRSTFTSPITLVAGQQYTINMYHSAASTGTFDRRDGPMQPFTVSPYASFVESRVHCGMGAQIDAFPDCPNTWAAYQRIIATP